MRKVLFGLFVMVILAVGTVGVIKSTDEPVEVIEENGVSTEVHF
ncbi:hypothetical protein [Oceanobacillus salinisoli]|nr:hypothetical protein [Oceanobacillus salinisoli]